MSLTNVFFWSIAMNMQAELADLQLKLEMGYTIIAEWRNKHYAIAELKIRNGVIYWFGAHRWHRLNDYDVIRPDYISPAGRRPSDWGYRDEDSLMAILLMD